MYHGALHITLNRKFLMTKATADSDVYQLHSISEDISVGPEHADSSGIFITKALDVL